MKSCLFGYCWLREPYPKLYAGCHQNGDPLFSSTSIFFTSFTYVDQVGIPINTGKPMETNSANKPPTEKKKSHQTRAHQVSEHLKAKRKLQLTFTDGLSDVLHLMAHFSLHLQSK